MAALGTEPVNEMRDWGLVPAAELERIVVISPHLDDAVLGCGRLLAAHPNATVIKVYAGAPETYPDPMTHWDRISGFEPGDDVLARRRDEDRAALDELGATPVWLDFVEHQYLERPDWVGAEQTADTLEAAVRAADPTAVLMPFGLANPDHGATHDAARVVRDRITDPAWFCYEDMGYKHIPGLLAWRIARMFRRGLWPTPAAVPVDVDLARKQAAVSCYPSQLLALEAEWRVAEKLAAPAPEQHWRLAPPPAGWEGLRADA